MTNAPKSPGLLARLAVNLPAYAVTCLRARLFGRPELRTDFPCNDCDMDVVADLREYYMVCDEVWAAAGLGFHDGFLCIGCLEDRLGRTLTSDDFYACPLNFKSARDSTSARLLDRMGDTAWMLPEIEARFGRHWSR